MVELERELTDEAGADRPTRDAGDDDGRMTRVGQRPRVDGVIGESLEQFPCVGARHVDRAPLRGPVEHVNVERHAVGEVADSGVHTARSTRG